MVRPLDHGGSNRVEFDIAVRGKQVAIRVDQAGLEASFLQRSAAPMATVEGGDVGLADLAHGQRYLPVSPELMGRCAWLPINTNDDLAAIRLHLQRQHALGTHRFRTAIEVQLGHRAGPAKIGRPGKHVESADPAFEVSRKYSGRPSAWVRVAAQVAWSGRPGASGCMSIAPGVVCTRGTKLSSNVTSRLRCMKRYNA